MNDEALAQGLQSESPLTVALPATVIAVPVWPGHTAGSSQQALRCVLCTPPWASSLWEDVLGGAGPRLWRAAGRSVGGGELC